MARFVEARTRRDTSERTEGNRIISRRISLFRRYFEGEQTAIFDGVVLLLVKQAIDENVITPENMPGECRLEPLRRDNLVLLDLMLCNLFFNPTSVPRHLLLDHTTGKPNEVYETVLSNEFAALYSTNALDIRPGFSAQEYGNIFSVPFFEHRLPVALTATLPFIAALHDPAMAEVIHIGNGHKVLPYIAESAYRFYAGVADGLGFQPTVRRIKTFIGDQLFPGIMQYVDSELARLKDPIANSNAVVEEIAKEVGEKLHSAGITAQVDVRKGGKSRGSLGTKVQTRFIEDLREYLGKHGFPTELMNLELSDPRKTAFERRGEGIRFYVPGYNSSVKLVGSELKFTLKSSATTHVFTYNTPTTSPFILPAVNEFGSDFAAFRIIIKSWRRQRSLEEVFTSIETIVTSTIRSILKKHGVSSVKGLDIRDYVSEPKPNGYQSLHIDWAGLLPLFSPFECIARTEAQHDRCERGAAAHGLYKGGDKTVLEPVLSRTKAIRTISKASTNGRVTEMDFRIRIRGKEESKSISVNGQLPTVADALFHGDVYLDTIREVRVNGKPVGLLEPFTPDSVFYITLVQNGEVGIISPTNAKGYVDSCVLDQTKIHLRRIIRSGKTERPRKR